MTPPTLTQAVDPRLPQQYEWIENIEDRADANHNYDKTDYSNSFDEIESIGEHIQAIGARFAVFYIDKHADPVQSQWVTSAMAQQFKLRPQHRMKLSSGNPILIKGSLPIELASSVKQTINKLGGSAWIQLQNSNGVTHERRAGERRSGFDRRALGRTDTNTDRRCRADIRQPLSYK